MEWQLPHGRNLRRGRVSEAGRIYLLTSVTKDRAPLFRAMSLARAVIHGLQYQQKLGRAESLAFVVMPDHLHWLARLGEGATLDTLMGSLKSYTARRVNVLRQSPGQPVWQPGYHDHALRQEEDLRSVARYLIANPLRAGLVRHIGDYPFWDAVWL
ncbi:transposase [Thiohalobacter sp. IOR34]|uniref:REP-associated tyrosine transposase n=1 Tax=Thiohalobacter sp. IOR34 TaxID=3057176 RepID=UPI0025B0B72A|nr:transposase [Thiohalobacter sp. IOR34]WJW75190.1 transposase [Thiohalobacter sp. IOR34]